jgi:hypothetical protein
MLNQAKRLFEERDGSPEAKNGSSGPSENKKALWFSEGVIVAATPLLAYALCFIYEAGYCNYFIIPASLIEVSFSTVMKTLGFLIIFGFVLIWTITFFLNLYRKKPDVLAFRILALALTIFTFVVIPLLIYGYDKACCVLVSVIIFIMALGLFVEPLFFCRDVKGYRNKLKASAERRSLLFIGRDIFPKLPKPIALIVPIIFLSLFFSFLGGLGFAEKQEIFLVTKTDPEMVVLRIYKDTAICGHFDDEKKVITGFSVMDIKSPPLDLEWRKIGRLEPGTLLIFNPFYMFESGSFKIAEEPEKKDAAKPHLRRAEPK